MRANEAPEKIYLSYETDEEGWIYPDYMQLNIMKLKSSQNTPKSILALRKPMADLKKCD